MKRRLLLTVFMLPSLLIAQTALRGLVYDESGKPLPYATVALLKPADSTLAFFGITNDQGAFDIRKISQGNYLMQVAFIGYQTFYKPLKMPGQSGDFGIVVLKTKPLNLSSAEVVAEHVPFLVKKDTIEYNAGAFKTRPDAVAEDLLRKLPGVEVDRAGNIKAMGEEVNNVTVDGKEFFSSDPKVATKNLPADAINKVQVFDKKSESAELAGIDDGSREKTINLMLKDGKKQAWLGDVSAGAATGNHYSASAKTYRFTAKNQFALLGMLNNINKFGFSFQDYLDFNGGMPSLMSGSSMRLTITSDNEVPLNFGQTINGLVTSGAGGLNYSFEPGKNKRFYASYLANGMHRDLKQSVNTLNYTSGSEFTQDENADEKSRNFSHRFTMGWKDKSDTTHTLVFNGNIGLSSARQDASSLVKTVSGGDLVSQLESQSDLTRNGLSGNASFAFLKRGKGRFNLFTTKAGATFDASLSNSDRLNLARYSGISEPPSDFQYRDNHNSSQRYTVSGNSLIRLARGFYAEPGLSVNAAFDNLKRRQGYPDEGNTRIDSLSPDFGRESCRITPALSFRYNNRKAKFVLGLQAVVAQSVNKLHESPDYTMNYSRMLPSFSWEYEFKTGRRLSLDYSSTVNEPQLSLLLPIVENSDPQMLFYGNRQLKPETQHDLFLNWLLFDQFSQTSVFVRAGGTFTGDKIGYSRTISEDFGQTITVLNTRHDYRLSGNVSFSTPLRFAGVNLHLDVDGSWDRGLTYVNTLENLNTKLSRSLRLSFDNRKKEKWDMDFGGEVTISNAAYSIQKSLSNRYLSLNYFADLSFNPDETWHLGLSADVVNYSSESFPGAVSIPLISAEAGINFLKNKRAMLMLEGYDLLDKNSGISRIAEMNFLRETRSNIIGRYVMVSFKYRINKAAKEKGGLEINVRRH